MAATKEKIKPTIKILKIDQQTKNKQISGASKDLKCVVFYAPVDMSNIHFLYSECTLSFLVL